MKNRLLVALFACFSLNPSSYALVESDSKAELSNFALETLELAMKQNEQLNDKSKSKQKSLSELGIQLPTEEKLKEVFTEKDKELVMKSARDGTSLSAVGAKIFSNASVRELQEKGKQMQQEFESQKKIVDKFDTLIFISFGLDEQTIKQLYQINAGSKRTALVIRGLIKGSSNIEDTIRRIQLVAKDLNLEVPPTILLNPTWFKQYNVTKVPTIIHLDSLTDKQTGDEKTGKPKDPVKEVARIEGLIDPSYLLERVKEGKIGYLGVKGPVAEIQEKDLIEEMQERAMKVDWAEKRKRALARAWKNQPIEELTPASVYRKRKIDPTVTVQKDITAPDPEHDGEILWIARKGQKINPLAQRNFDRFLVIFDPTNKKEFEFVSAKLPEWQNKYSPIHSRTRFMITNLDRDNGWDDYNRIQNHFDSHIFVLLKDVKKTFKLEHTPCIVYAEDYKFIVEEFGVNEQ